MTFAIVFFGLLGLGITAFVTIVLKYLGFDNREAGVIFLIASLAVIISTFVLLFTT